jgi:cardiolipin synthase A/B
VPGRLGGAVAALLALVLALSGCVSLPPVDAEVARAQQLPQPQGAIALIREEGERIAGFPYVGGNSVRLLVNGPASYAAMEQAIRAARRRIDIESYVFDRHVGESFGELLLQKRAAGVEVNLIYDAIGSIETPAALFDRLRRGGVNVLQYHPVSDLGAINDRDHRKLLVVDAAVVVSGGVNISKLYFNGPATAAEGDGPESLPWRDTDVRIEGPVAAEFERLFEQNWRQQGGAPLPPPPATPAQARGTALVQAVEGLPGEHEPLIYRSLLVAIGLARRSVHLTTGFFAPTPDLAALLESTARRGVDVAIVVPSHSESTLTIAAGRSYYAELLAAGVRIYERQGAVLHAKTAVIDGVWSMVGSSNLDWRSVIYNAEIDAAIIDPGFAAEMEALFRSDLARSREIEPASWATRSLGERFDEWMGSLLQFIL